MRSDPETKICELRELPIGARVLVRCKFDWRTAAVSSQREERVVLTIASPSGRTYRKSCPVETQVIINGTLPILGEGDWREKFVKYDVRW